MSLATPHLRASTRHPTTRTTQRRHRWLTIALATAAVLFIGIVIFVAYFIDPPLRAEMERRLNANLKGYTAELAELDFHPLGFGLTLEGLTIRQDKHPKPAVIEIPQFEASVEWKQLLRLRLVADVGIVRPKLHIDRTQFVSEMKDPVPVEDKGWQEAVESIYPLKINEFRIEDADVTYIDSKDEPPLHLTRLNIIARNIRNVSDGEKDYPSQLWVRSNVFETGSIKIDGDADFLRTPYAAVDTDITLDKIPLDKIKAVANNVNLLMKGGVLSAQGHVEYTPKTKIVQLREAAIDGVSIDYEHNPKTVVAEAQRAEQVRETVGDLTETPETIVLIDNFRIRKSQFGYIDKTANPDYRLFVKDTDVTLKNFSNKPGAKDSNVAMNGLFMGSGQTKVDATFQPLAKTAEFDLNMAIEPTQLTTMNDMLRAFGNFDVVAGTFAFYSKVSIHDGNIRGWVKPMFEDMNVYSPGQDANKGFLHQVYENVLEGVKVLFENSRETVATETTISGRVENPRTSTWDILINLAKNAFVRAIVPGFETRVGKDIGVADTITAEPAPKPAGKD